MTTTFGKSDWQIRQADFCTCGGSDEYCGCQNVIQPYRGWTISYDPPPIPIRDFDWQAVGPNYDAWTEDGEWTDNGQKAAAPTYSALIKEIDAWFEDQSA